ncbi:MAG: glycolate oxidase subunit GlcF [Pseudomonadota bacterium]|nr:glycolate oxidase subunit GlcF [Pseudomonadota bacterium]
MQTQLADFIRGTRAGNEAESILRACVHCGFCNATCPTYQLLGDELDGPRGRIYLIKQMLEGEPVTGSTQLHLDRCLTCRACETTCPSGVRYGRLVDIGREVLGEKVQRGFFDRVQRATLRFILTRPLLFDPLLKLGQLARPVLPRTLARKVPARAKPTSWPRTLRDRTMLLLEGCVQPSLAPNIDAAAARVLDRLGITLLRVPQARCCGAIAHHLDDEPGGRNFARRNIDAWTPYIGRGAEAVVSTASGCGAHIREYGHLLADDPVYAESATRIAALSRDISEVVLAERENLAALLHAAPPGHPETVAFHSPCTLQHGLKIRGVVEDLLIACGFSLSHVSDGHLCCGSAGTYSLLQPELSQRLLANKIAALEAGRPRQIVTANIGCLLQLRSAASRPVRHWIELLDERLNEQT